MSYRSPADLNKSIEAHKALHLAQEPKCIMIRDRYFEANRSWFRSRLHTLCCGKGALYEGIPAVVTPSPMVEDFLICY